MMAFLEKETMKKSRFCEVDDLSGTLTIEYKDEAPMKYLDLSLIPLHIENDQLERSIPEEICSDKAKDFNSYLDDYTYFLRNRKDDKFMGIK